MFPIIIELTNRWIAADHINKRCLNANAYVIWTACCEATSMRDLVRSSPLVVVYANNTSHQNVTKTKTLIHWALVITRNTKTPNSSKSFKAEQTGHTRCNIVADIKAAKNHAFKGTTKIMFPSAEICRCQLIHKIIWVFLSHHYETYRNWKLFDILCVYYMFQYIITNSILKMIFCSRGHTSVTAMSWVPRASIGYDW